MQLTIVEASTILRLSPRAIRDRLKNGTLKGTKKDGRWTLRSQDLPMDEGRRRQLRQNADCIRGAVEAAIPAAAGGKGGGQRAGIADQEVFTLTRAVFDQVAALEDRQRPAEEALVSAMVLLGEGHHQFGRRHKLEAFNRARAAISHAAVLLLLSEQAALVDQLELSVLPRLAGLIRWVESLKASG